MDLDKLKQWVEMAKNMQGGDFWGNIFDQEFAKQFINSEQRDKASTAESQQQPSREVKQSRNFPPIDILEGEEHVQILIELPGVTKENFELGLNGNNLVIKGRVLPLNPHARLTYSERFYGDFQRQITLPDTITANVINAKIWNGILIVHYPRIKVKGERIPIE
ncbi:Hsp20/alpha crystallin family protein [Bacillus rubiinfantis]|uniref:Hsp20/alpha crystallin family protein n=1 Tax=Bacillus rubiinfantis TaxID=1499680 RepID=UPI0005A7C7BE|nr:Hsp20/alpha crystallin family protein [Bacillus rubiinfantis]